MTQFGSHIKIHCYRKSYLKLQPYTPTILTYCIDDAETRNGQYSSQANDEFASVSRTRVKWDGDLKNTTTPGDFSDFWKSDIPSGF